MGEDDSYYLLRFTKTGPARFLSHHDVARAWERAVRRAGVPLSYSRGFTPRPRVVFGPPLPVGAEGLREWMAFSLRAAMDADHLAIGLRAASSSGLDVIDVRALATRRPKPLRAIYELHVTDAPPELGDRVRSLLESPATLVTRARTAGAPPRDIRPGIIEITLDGPSPLRAIVSLVDTQVVGTRDLAAALEVSFDRVIRTDVQLDVDAV